MVPRILAIALMLGPWTGPAAAAAERPVVVELFTSEGCSSCPPADAYLTDLARGRSEVLPLAFHVTYWNSLGWTDPFSMAAATERQGRYAARFGEGSYTPEMVVDGRQGLVGSDRGAAEAAIAAARRQDRDAPALDASLRGGTVSVTLGTGRGTARIVLVGYDGQHRTSVGRGENSGRTLVESNIVRSIASIGRWSGTAATATAPAPAGDSAAVLLEAPDGSILAAARVTPAP